MLAVEIELEGKRILERLRGGERLIAFTAAGVQWTPASGEWPNANDYEFPNNESITWLFKRAWIDSTRYNYRLTGSLEGSVIPLVEIVEVKE